MEISRFTFSSVSITVCLLISVFPSGFRFTRLHHSVTLSLSRSLVLLTVYTQNMVTWGLRSLWTNVSPAVGTYSTGRVWRTLTCMSQVLSVPSLSAVTKYFPQGLTVMTIDPRSLLWAANCPTRRLWAVFQSLTKPDPPQDTRSAPPDANYTWIQFCLLLFVSDIYAYLCVCIATFIVTAETWRTEVEVNQIGKLRCKKWVSPAYLCHR